MNLARITFPVRHLGVMAVCVLVVGTGVGTALADPPAQTHDYFAQVAAGTRPGRPWRHPRSECAVLHGRAGTVQRRCSAG